MTDVVQVEFDGLPHFEFASIYFSTKKLTFSLPKQNAFFTFWQKKIRADVEVFAASATVSSPFSNDTTP